ncbi:hypothetical protein GGTG_06000 [Gaeumannomyces tritici R3-111a-1]|uniref:Uncharacterized protein n=1 Tax=Gaeumannomyces tritici (strain R3-111a-1) TaxID=644352 RepID=J3NXJ4_GAET3|nr:hypothetical protein GGTG_06000 [Gaeumannomyces tritici R3-111a-1]EJT76076.1 hypothetical protein GGTG_06000 [Gaeumannomyces tritici R3-111a-1]
MKFTTSTALVQALFALLATQAVAAPTPFGELEPRRNVRLGLPGALALKMPGRRSPEFQDEEAQDEGADIEARQAPSRITPGTCRRNICIN